MDQLESFVTGTINDNLWTAVPWLLIAAGVLVWRGFAGAQGRSCCG